VDFRPIRLVTSAAMSGSDYEISHSLRRSILLMDGTVIEPEWLGKGPKGISKAYYAE